jgi:hypothetical protein
VLLIARDHLDGRGFMDFRRFRVPDGPGMIRNNAPFVTDFFYCTLLTGQR